MEMTTTLDKEPMNTYNVNYDVITSLKEHWRFE